MKVLFDPIADAERRAFSTDDAQAVKMKLNAEQTRPRIPLVQIVNEPKDIEKVRRIIESVKQSHPFFRQVSNGN